MSQIDWMVLIGTTLFIVLYGIYKSRGTRDIRGYLLADKQFKWWTIGLSIMATQASAITFLSTPGQAFDDGMGFVQFYFGLPIATVILCIVAIPIYHKLNVFTAYEYLENRFDLKTRSVGAGLFLLQRGLAAGLTIYAPALIISTVLPWSTWQACVVIGSVVIVYTVLGGTKAVSQTQKQQMLIILVGMVIAGVWIVRSLPESISFGNALSIAGTMGKLESIDFSFDISDRYNIWSGVIASTFLMLSYFGTDQSQVQRYLGGRSVAESRIGLLISGMVKVPMQFLILLVGVLLFVFYQFEAPALNFNQRAVEMVDSSRYAHDYQTLSEQAQAIHVEKKEKILALDQAWETQSSQETQFAREAQALDSTYQALRMEAKLLMVKAQLEAEGENPELYTREELADKQKRDSDRIFLTFVLDYLPEGLVGLLMAVILAASMSSTSSELNALASTTTIDIYKRLIKRDGSDAHDLKVSKLLTLGWGLYAIAFSLFADRLENLIQAVNILGSFVYGTILGIFLAAFFLKQVKGTAVFYGALLAQALVIICSFTPMAFLWYNVVGCLGVLGFSLIIQSQLKQNS